MTITPNRAAQNIAVILIFTVITQVAYMALEASGNSAIAYPIWRFEAVLGLVMAILAFVLVPRDPLAGGALALAGFANMIQTGMGLTMFYQLGYGGEGEPNPVFFPVLGMSFFLYFAAKAFIGFAAIKLGLDCWNRLSGAWKVIGIIAAIGGAVALLTNIVAMAMGMDYVFIAGAAGTVAALLLALVLAPAVKLGETA